MNLGHSMDDLATSIARMKGISVDDALRFLSGKEFANATQANLMARGGQATKLGRLAGSKAANKILRLVPGLGVGLTALDAASVVTDDVGIANKVMDGTAMAVGGTIGAALGGPLGATTGASLGKMVSDGTQYIFGGGESPEERKLREALAMLSGGR